MGVSDAGDLPVDVVRAPVPAGYLGCQVAPFYAPRASGCPVLGFRYGKHFLKGLFIKNVFQKR
jgi:hypothetical protein